MTDISIKYQLLPKNYREKTRQVPPITINTDIMYSLDKGIKSVSDPPSGFSSKCVRNQRGKWHPTPVLLRENSHGWRSLVGCNPWGRKEQLHFHFSLSCIGEGNVNPLQCSCLENPRDSRTWWAAIYGVARVGHN